MENTPIFVKIDEYEDILDVVEVINDKVDEIKTALQDLKDVKQQEDEHIKQWNSQLDFVTQKMKYVNETLKEM
jgi:vacuolar-type H+-ATPase subunit I/STV1